MNNEQLLKQAEMFCTYSATHSETPELAAFWNNVRLAFLAALTDVIEGRNNTYRSALLAAANYLNQDIAGHNGPITEHEPDGE